jgi:hypothetical protein
MTATPSGRIGGAMLAIVNKRFAERMWPNVHPIGKRLNCGDDGSGCAEVIGVVGDVNHISLVEEAGYDFQPASRSIDLMSTQT